jgi:hypothetical protein
MDDRTIATQGYRCPCCGGMLYATLDMWRTPENGTQAAVTLRHGCEVLRATPEGGSADD